MSSVNCQPPRLKSATDSWPTAERPSARRGEALRRGPAQKLGDGVALAFGVAGGVASMVEGNLVSGILSATAAAAGGVRLASGVTTPYAYLFSIRRRFA